MTLISTRQSRILFCVALRFRRASLDRFVGDFVVGALAGLLYVGLMPFGDSTHAAVQVLRNFSKWFMDALTQFDYVIFLVSIFTGCLIAMLYRESSKEKIAMKYGLRPFLGFVSDASFLALGATSVRCAALFLQFDFELVTHSDHLRIQFFESLGDAAYFGFAAPFLWIIVGIIEGHAERHLFGPSRSDGINFRLILRCAGFGAFVLGVGLVVGMDSESAHAGVHASLWTVAAMLVIYVAKMPLAGAAWVSRKARLKWSKCLAALRTF